MGKTACNNKKFEDKEDSKYECIKCGAKVKKKEKVCKSVKLRK